MTADTQTQAGHPVHAELRPDVKNTSNEYFALSYAVAATIGIVAVFVSADLWLVPLLSMVVYYVLGNRKAKLAGTIFEFADSVYYLGFTLSVGSLLASLDPFALHGKPDPEKIFHYFGLALLTTLAGVVMRTVVQQFYRLPSESLEAANRRVGEEMETFVSELGALRDHVLNHASTAVASYKGHLLPQLEELTSQVRCVIDRFEDALLVAGALEDSGKRAVRALDILGTTYDTAAKSFDVGHARLVESQHELSDQLSQASQALEQASRATTSSMNEVRVTAVGSAASLDALRRSLQPTSGASDELRLALVSVTRGIAEASSTLHDGIGALQGEARVLKSTTGSLQRSSAAIEKADVGGALGRLAAQVERFASSVAEEQRLTAQETSGLSASVSSALNACRSLHEAVQEIAAALATRLETMP